MVKPVTSHELIRSLIDGESPRAKGRLVRMGASAVRPLLEAMVGVHGPVGEALPELVDALGRIAKADVNAVIPALKDHPALNIVVWAVGHGAVKRCEVNKRAHRALKSHHKHDDVGIRAVAYHQLQKIEKSMGKTRASTVGSGRKASAKKAAKRASKKGSAKKK